VHQRCTKTPAYQNPLLFLLLSSIAFSFPSTSQGLQHGYHHSQLTVTNFKGMARIGDVRHQQMLNLLCTISIFMTSLSD